LTSETENNELDDVHDLTQEDGRDFRDNEDKQKDDIHENDDIQEEERQVHIEHSENESHDRQENGLDEEEHDVVDEEEQRDEDRNDSRVFLSTQQLGFFILMGLVPLSSIYDYWSTNPIYHYSPIASRISRDRFVEIHRYLHFVDNSALTGYGEPESDNSKNV
jgi:hypothetical protein